MCRSVCAALFVLLSSAAAWAQTPLIDRYASFFSTPFESAQVQIVVSQPPGNPLPLEFVRSVLKELWEQWARDRARIRRVAGGFGSSTGFCEATLLNGNSVDFAGTPNLALEDVGG